MLKKTVLLIVLIASISSKSANAQSKENSSMAENILGAKILSVNRNPYFIVIDAGTEVGINEGANLNLLKDGKSLAVLQVIRAKERVSACDIKFLEPNTVLKEGDVYSITISTDIRRSAYKAVTEKKEASVSKKMPPARGKTMEKTTLPLLTALPMTVHINSRKEIVNYYLNEAVRDMNFIVTSSNTKDGIFTAHKNLALPLWEEVWADFRGTTDHRAVYDINTFDDETGTTLKLDIHIIYTTKAGKTAQLSVRRGSEAVSDALELVKRVKNQSEILTKER